MGARDAVGVLLINPDAVEGAGAKTEAACSLDAGVCVRLAASQGHRTAFTRSCRW